MSIALAALILVLAGMTGTAAAQDVTWTELVNVSVSGTMLQKTGGCDGCDDAGARSQQDIGSGEGYIEFTVGEANTFWFGGLSNGNGSPSYGGIDFAFRFNGAGGADVMENGVYKGGDTTYAAGDVFRIAVVNGRVHYRRNGTLLYVSQAAWSYPLVLDVALGTVGTTVRDAKLFLGNDGSEPPPPPPPLTGSNVTWTDLVNVTVGDSVLEKTGGCGGCPDAGARTQQEIDSGGGYVEFTVGEGNTFWVAGLSHGNSDTSFSEIDFAFRFNGAGTADVLENGEYKGGDTPYSVGDVFRITVAAGQVYYRRNGMVVYVSQATPTYPLVLDTSLGSVGARIYNTKLYQGGIGQEDDPPPSGEGGLLEKAGQLGFRPHPTAAQIQAFLPAGGAKGAFTFPEYNTRGVRITNADDCAGGVDCVWYVGYSYWRRMNNHRSSNTIDILMGLDQARGGTGPTRFSYNKETEQVENLGALFDDPDVPNSNDPTGGYKASTAEQWYFSATQATKLYVFLIGGAQLWRFDVSARRFDADPAMDLDACRAQSVCPSNAAFIIQPNSSDDDHAHSATVQDGNYTKLGCVAYRDNAQPAFYFHSSSSGLDECQVDRSGRWLVVQESNDNVVIDLQTGASTRLLDADGAHHHLDLGHGYSVGGDNQHAPPNATTLITFPVGSTQWPLGPTVMFNNTINNEWNLTVANHVSHTNAKPGVPASQQYACGSDANVKRVSQADEIVCFPLDPYRNGDNSIDVLVVAPVMTNLGPDRHDQNEDYRRAPKGNLDVTGGYFIWTTNMGVDGGRLDAFIVKVPANRLMGGQ